MPRSEEKDSLSMGIQQTLAGIYKYSIVKRIPFKFSYVFECDDRPHAKYRHVR